MRGCMMMSQVNQVELALLIGAFIFSKQRVLPAMLILYSLLYRLVSTLSDEMLVMCDKLYDASLSGYGVPMQAAIDRCDNNLMTVYIFEGFMMFLVSLLFAFLMGRLAKITFLVVAAQASLSLLMAICVYVVNKSDEALDFAFEVHYSINSNFAIIYTVIAWICVYLSWKGKHER